MKIAGIVAEYNPFHNGHALQLRVTRAPQSEGGAEATHIVAVMSGNFVQRGEPAIASKFDRAHAAMAGGVDLVIELPTPWCLASAEGFAYGAISLLDALGCVELLSFGSECGDTNKLEKIATVTESERFASLMKYQLGLGIAFAEAQQRALTEIVGESAAAVLRSPNNLLGIEYLKALKKLRSPLKAFTIQRQGPEHDGNLPLGDLASASLLRELIGGGRIATALGYIPSPAAAVLSEAAVAGRLPAEPERLERAVLATLRTQSAAELAGIAGVAEGLENRLTAAVRTAGTLKELEEAVKTRRYPLTRIRRLIWSAFLGLPADLCHTRPPYIRVLAANERGREILAAAHPTLPVIHRASQIAKADETVRTAWERECRITDLYGLAFARPLPCGLDATTGLIRE